MDGHHALPRLARLWPDPGRGPWVVVLRFAVIDGRAECVGLEMRSFQEEGEPDRLIDEGVAVSMDREAPSWWDAGPPSFEDVTETVTATLLRKLPIGRLIDEARPAGALLAKEGRWTEAGYSRVRGEASAAFERPRRRGRPVHWTRDRLAEVASVYSNAWVEGQPPRKAVAEHFVVTPAAAARLVSRARKEGLLGPTTKGRPGIGRTRTEEDQGG